MRISVRFFLAYREIVGARQSEVQVAEGTTAGDLLSLLVARHPRLGDLARASLVAVNREYVPPETALSEGDEVVFVPPVSGGRSAWPCS